MDEADPGATQTPPTPAIHPPAANDDSDDDSADWNPRHAKEQFQQRMQSQTRHIRSQTRQATQPVQPRPHIPAIVEETQPRRWHIRYYHNDPIGTPRELTSEAGEILWRATYKAWGNTLKQEWLPERASAHQTPQQQTEEENLTQNLRFQGQYFDEETGLHYNRFRYYDPDCGRFISQDPIGLAGGDNLYQYAPNPSGWVDPWGLEKKRMKVKDSGHHAPAVRKSQGRPFEMKRGDRCWPTIFPKGDDPEHDHWRLHDAERMHIGPRQGSFLGTDLELISAYEKAYSDPKMNDIIVDLRSPDGSVILCEDCTPLMAILKMKEWLTLKGMLC